jgi:hypothetical protein
LTIGPGLVDSGVGVDGHIGGMCVFAQGDLVAVDANTHRRKQLMSVRVEEIDGMLLLVDDEERTGLGEGGAGESEREQDFHGRKIVADDVPG